MNRSTELCAIISDDSPSPEGSCATREIDLATAISEIKQAREETEGGKSPFFIIAGGGISAPFIPLASEITQECKTVATKYGRASEPPSNLPLDAYSHWFERAFPQAIQRQRYFKKLMEGKPISHANFRLAHLLSEKRLATLVVTPNFDDFLSRALTLFGQPHIVCDHPNTVERIDPESDEIQIVHVHGTYWFYDCCNLRGEIQARTEDSRERSVTMTSLLDNIFSRHSALVIGYAGWESDVIMTALKRRLLSGLPNNLYWFCFRRSGLEPLGAFLKGHRDVCLVLPPAPPSKPEPQTTSDAQLAGSGSDSEPTPTSQSVLDRLVEVFTEKSPSLTLDPIGFFANQLTKSFPPDSPEKSGEDIYELRNVIRRVELARESENKPTPIETEIEHVRDAVRRSAYLEALQVASQVEPKLRSDAQRETLMESVMSAALGLGDNAEAAIRGYELVLRLETVNTGLSPRVQERAAVALYNKGAALVELERMEEAIQAYDELLRRFGDANEPVLRRRVIRALYGKGRTLSQLPNRGDQAIQAYDELLHFFDNGPEPEMRKTVAMALVSKSAQLNRLDRGEESIQACDEALRRFGDATEPALREWVAKALFNKGSALVGLNRGEEAVRTLDEVPRRFGDALEIELREPVARALFGRGAELGRLNRREEAIQTYDEVLRRFGDTAEATLREWVARALINKGIALGQLNRDEEEIQTYDELLRRFGDATEPALRERVAKALLYKGQTLNTLKRAQEARLSFEEVLKRFADSPDAALQQLVEEARAELKSLDATETKG
jgi:tetratricopeptide (TPR) repeat protein